MPRKLKVFQAQFGFYDTVVAAASQTAALRAWGAHQNLFADGQASPATDEAAMEAALAHPDVPLRRGIGTGDPFTLNPRLPHLPDVPDGASKPAGAKGPAKPNPKAVRKPVPRPDPPSRAALDAAEAALETLNAAHRREEADFERRRAEIEAEEGAARRRYEATLANIRDTLEREQRAFNRATERYGRES